MDDADRASHIETWERDAALTHFKRGNPQPKQRIANGVIVCIRCDEPISSKRLAGVPHAARCLQCQITYDQENQNGRR